MPRHLSIRAASAALAILATLALAACGGKDAAPPASPAPAADAAAGAPAAPPAVAPESAAVPAAPGAGDALPSPAGASPAGVPDHVVVEVNGVPIRARKILGAIEMNKTRARATGRSMGPEDEAALYEAALDAFVADALLYQAAQAAGTSAAEAEIAEEMKSVQSGFPSAAKYQEFLKKAGLTDADVREEAVHRITVASYVKKIAGNTAVSEAEARAFYDANKQEFAVPEQVQASIIVVTSKPGDAEPLKADARKRIEEARKRAAAGEDFAALAKQYSQVPNAAKGGELGFFGRGDGLFPKIEDMAFSTPAGQVSPVFETPTGFNVVKVVEKKAPGIRTFDEVKAMLIVELGRQKEGAAVEAKITELHKAAKIELKDPSFLPRFTPPPAAPGAVSIKTK